MFNHPHIENAIGTNMRHITPETPVPYLVNANAFMQARHRLALERHLAEASKLAPELRDLERRQTLLRCIEGTIGVLQGSVQRHLGAS